LATEIPTLTLAIAPHGIDCRVALDGVDISHYLAGVEVIARVNERTRVTLDVLAGIEAEGAAGELLRGLVPSHARPIVEAFEVRPGSVLVCRVRGRINQLAHDHLVAQLREVWPDPSIRLVVLDDSVELSVLAPGLEGGGGTGGGVPGPEGDGGA
jgi:hypothetical protein